MKIQPKTYWFKRWGKFLQIHEETILKHGEYTFDQRNINSFGRWLLKLFWCEYIPLQVEVICKFNGINMSTENREIYYCEEGVIIKFLRRNIFGKKISVS